jgi:hypothetical protein
MTKRWKYIRRAARSLRRCVRHLLVVLAVLGLLPVGDVVQTLRPVGQHDSEQATERAPCQDDCGGECTKLGCTPFEHHCHCCVGLPAVPPPIGFVKHTEPRERFDRPRNDARAIHLATAPPTPPPTV